MEPNNFYISNPSSDMITPGYGSIESSIGNTAGNIVGIIQWLGYVLAIGIVIFTIIFSIIKFTSLIKNKKPIKKTVIFVVCMLVLAIVMFFGATFLGIFNAF